jgi:hypothetical protein
MLVLEPGYPASDLRPFESVHSDFLEFGLGCVDGVGIWVWLVV